MADVPIHGTWVVVTRQDNGHILEIDGTNFGTSEHDLRARRRHMKGQQNGRGRNAARREFAQFAPSEGFCPPRRAQPAPASSPAIRDHEAQVLVHRIVFLHVLALDGGDEISNAAVFQGFQVHREILNEYGPQWPGKNMRGGSNELLVRLDSG